MADKPSVQHIQIEPDQSGQRIDNFLFNRFKDVPKGHIYRILRKGQVRVNKGRIKATYRIQAGDILRIPPMVTKPDFNQAQKGTAPQRVLSALSRAVLYEDSDIIIINKPAGLAVHAGTRNPYGVIDAMQQMSESQRQLQLVHRLDKDTSGCLILAKNRPVLLKLHTMLKQHRIEKCYTTLMRGIVQPEEQQVSAPLAFDRSDSALRKTRIDEEGKSAETTFKVIDWMKDVSLVEARIATGRTHQIRAHADYIGHPVAGDDKYGDHAFNKKMKSQGLKRLFLHAASLDFMLDQRRISVTAPLPSDLKKVLEKL